MRADTAAGLKSVIFGFWPLRCTSVMLRLRYTALNIRCTSLYLCISEGLELRALRHQHS